MEEGKRVVFGPSPEKNYIENVRSGKKVLMWMKDSGYYMLDTDMGKTGKAEVCVCGQRCGGKRVPRFVGEESV